MADEDAVAEGLQGLDEAHHRAFARTSSAHREGHSAQVFSTEDRKKGEFCFEDKGTSQSVTLFFNSLFPVFTNPFLFPFPL